MSNKKIKILLTAAECTPFAKVGGLADVIGSLPKEIYKRRYKIDVILPLYGNIDTKFFAIHNNHKYFFINFSNQKEKIEIFTSYLPKSKVRILFLKNNKFLSTNEVYINTSGTENQKRFTFFSLAVKEFIKQLKNKNIILHCHDWHTGLLPYLIKNDRETRSIKTIFTIHNIANQGIWDTRDAQKFGLDFANRFEEKINFMEIGITFADHVTTVSQTYAKEIMTKKFGYNLAPLLRRQRQKVSGVLNGIDTDEFNPQTDRLIYKNFNATYLNNKTFNKLKLQQDFGWKKNTKTPLLGVISRLFEQKGLDWLAQIMPKIAQHNIQLVVLGTGDRQLEKTFKQLEKIYPNKLRAIIDFQPILAQKIYAASDIFLVPSRFEPCGLTQMIAMRYGTVPIVRSTGGLKDTVKQYQKNKNKITGTGFVFKQEKPQALYLAIVKALKVYNNKNNWGSLQKNCMRQDFSWKKSAQEYIALYKQLIKE